MVPPQFTPYRSLTGACQLRRLYRALPVLTYFHFSKATPKGIPHPGTSCLAPTGSSLKAPYRYVLFFIIVLSLSVIHQFTTGGRNSQQKYDIFLHAKQKADTAVAFFHNRCRYIILKLLFMILTLYKSFTFSFSLSCWGRLLQIPVTALFSFCEMPGGRPGDAGRPKSPENTGLSGISRGTACLLSGYPPNEKHQTFSFFSADFFRQFRKNSGETERNNAPV